MKDDLIFIKHIQDCIQRIDIFMKRVSKKEFVQNEEKQSAVIRQIEIIGEAVKNLSEDFRKKYPQIEWRKIAGMRDKLIHFYFGVDLDAVWYVAKDNLPKLKKQIRQILEKEK